jgi:phosphatidylinositol N-acetylglucosaminyltransferase subunit H
MLRSASQHLTVHSPSSTTISYTVSNALPRSTTSSQILFALGNLLRTFLCISVLAIDAAKLQSILYLAHGPIDLPLAGRKTGPGALAWTVANAVDWRLLVAGSFLVIYFCLRKGYTGASLSLNQESELCADSCCPEETLLVLRGLGVQTSTSSPTYLSTSTTRFIPTTQIQDIIIHEAFKGLEVRFYLAIIVEGATEMVVVFPV